MNLKDLRIAIKAAKRVTGKAPAKLNHYAEAQMYLELWRKKLALAKTKVRKYENRVKRYQKLFGGSDGNEKRGD